MVLGIRPPVEIIFFFQGIGVVAVLAAIAVLWGRSAKREPIRQTLQVESWAHEDLGVALRRVAELEAELHQPCSVEIGVPFYYQGQVAKVERVHVLSDGDFTIYCLRERKKKPPKEIPPIQESSVLSLESFKANDDLPL